MRGSAGPWPPSCTGVGPRTVFFMFSFIYLFLGLFLFLSLRGRPGYGLLGERLRAVSFFLAPPETCRRGSTPQTGAASPLTRTATPPSRNRTSDSPIFEDRHALFAATTCTRPKIIIYSLQYTIHNLPSPRISPPKCTLNVPSHPSLRNTLTEPANETGDDHRHKTGIAHSTRKRPQNIACAWPPSNHSARTAPHTRRTPTPTPVHNTLLAQPPGLSGGRRLKPAATVATLDY